MLLLSRRGRRWARHSLVPAVHSHDRALNVAPQAIELDRANTVAARTGRIPYRQPARRLSEAETCIRQGSRRRVRLRAARRHFRYDGRLRPGARGRSGSGAVKVADVMSTAVEFVDGDVAVKAAAELMGELDVGALPVGTAAALDGIVTDRDVLFRVVAAGLDPRATLVRDIASRPVISCRDGDDLQVAMDLMAANHIRRLPVQDDHGIFTGWVTLADISRKLLVDSLDLQNALSALTEDRRETAG